MSEAAKMKYVRLGNSGLKVSRISMASRFRSENSNSYCSFGLHVLWNGRVGKVGFARRKVVAVVESRLGSRHPNLGHS